MDSASSELVTVSVADQIATLTINREKALNALDASVIEALDGAVASLEKQDLRAVILTGAGQKAFVAGADIKAMSELSLEDAKRFAERGQTVFQRIASLPFPVLAAVNGFALGGGLELALTADLIYCSDNAKLGLPEVSLGLLPGFGGTVRLARRIGTQAASELILTGDAINAERALSLGLVVAVFPQAELIDKVSAVAKKIASRGPLAVRACKRLLASTLEIEPLAQAERERQEFAQLFNTADQREGCKAFLDKRAPAFTGR